MAMVIAFLELVGIATLAITEPTLTILNRGAPFLASYRPRRLDFVVATAIISLGPAAVITGFEAIAAVGSRSASDILHAVALGFLTALFFNVIAKHLSTLRVRHQFVVIAVSTVALSALYWEVDWSRLALLALVPFGVVVVLRFLGSERIDKCVVRERALASAPEFANPARVVFIVFDELPLMSLLDGTGAIAPIFPNFSELSQTANWHRNTTTISAGTRKAVPAILTGCLPREGLLPTASDHPNTLFSLLRSKYRLNVHESLTQLAAQTSAKSFATGWTALSREALRLCVQYNSPLKRDDVFFGDRRLFKDSLAAGTQFIATLTASSEPVLDFLHILLPHRPWHYCGDGRDYGGGVIEGGGPHGYQSPAAVGSARQRHLLQVQAADRFLGSVVTRLREIDAYDDALIVVTADHGIAIQPGQPFRRATAENYEEVLWVPLFMKHPQQREGSTSDQPRLTVDILPIIAAQLEVNIPWDVDGVTPAQAPGDRSLVGTVTLTNEHVPSNSQPLFDRGLGFANVLDANVQPSTPRTPRDFYHLGEFRDLIGRKVAELTVTPHLEAKGEISANSGFDKVRSDTTFVPWAFVTGEIAGHGAADSVVIAINEVIVGSAALRSTGSTTARFQTVLDPDQFSNGHNQLQLFIVPDPANAASLLSVATMQHQARATSASRDTGVPSGFDSE